MKHDIDEVIRGSHFRFIGKILSVFTHELNNHLAIIKESAGLMEDILSSQRASLPQVTEESLKITKSIETQIGKTSWLCKQLKNFGHRMDSPLSTFSVNQSIEELLVLLNRTANQRKVHLEKDFHENIPMIYSSSSKLQFLIFCLIDNNLKRLAEDSKIIFKTLYLDGSISISISPKGKFIETDEKNICSDDIYQHVINQLGGNISQKDGEVTITLPLSLASGATAPE